jgi:enoyl-CoA hydratase/carnithine racemase
VTPPSTDSGDPGPLQSLEWSSLDRAGAAAELCRLAQQPQLLVVTFTGSEPGPCCSWQELEPWTRSRAVTIADIRSLLHLPALEVALTADLVCLREGVALHLAEPHEPLSPGLIWALGRAGQAALARGLLGAGPISAAEALRLGLIHDVVAPDAALPIPDPCSLPALIAARDLMRARALGKAGMQLELATFRLLFATGDPGEGARAFLERRPPDF